MEVIDRVGAKQEQVADPHWEIVVTHTEQVQEGLASALNLRVGVRAEERAIQCGE